MCTENSIRVIATSAAIRLAVQVKEPTLRQRTLRSDTVCAQFTRPLAGPLRLQLSPYWCTAANNANGMDRPCSRPEPLRG